MLAACHRFVTIGSPAGFPCRARQTSRWRCAARGAARAPAHSLATYGGVSTIPRLQSMMSRPSRPGRGVGTSRPALQKSPCSIRNRSTPSPCRPGSFTHARADRAGNAIPSRLGAAHDNGTCDRAPMPRSREEARRRQADLAAASVTDVVDRPKRCAGARKSKLALASFSRSQESRPMPSASALLRRPATIPTGGAF